MKKMKMMNWVINLLMGSYFLMRVVPEGDGGDIPPPPVTEPVVDGDKPPAEGGSGEGDGDEPPAEGAAKSEGDGDKPAEGAPESYADFTIPDGMEMDTSLTEAFLPEFKEMNLTQEQAQRQVDLYTKVVQAREKEQADTYQKTVSEWEKSVANDPDLGGDHFAETKRLTSVGLTELGTPELGKFLDDYGIGNHPEIVRLMKKVGSLVDEDSGPGQGGANNVPLSRAEKLYGVE